jgi:GT2 family glycosyltransferase
MPRLAIQVIPYKSSGHIAPLLESLHAQTFRDFDVWFYDNSENAGEAEKTRAMVEASGIPHHFHIGEKNIGFDGGHQAMYDMHTAPLVMLLNDDAYLDPGYLEAAVRRIESDARIGSVTGLVYRWSKEADRIIDTAGLEYRCLGKIVDRFAGESAGRMGEAIAVPSEVYGVSGAIGIYRRSAIEKTGWLFDPSWFMYKEDADLAIRLRKSGFVAWFEPAAIAYHRRGLKEDRAGIFARLANERKRNPKLRAYSYANQWRMYRAHFRLSLGAHDIAATVIGEVLRSAMVFLASPIVFFKAWRMILTGTSYDHLS